MINFRTTKTTPAPNTVGKMLQEHTQQSNFLGKNLSYDGLPNEVKQQLTPRQFEVYKHTHNRWGMPYDYENDNELDEQITLATTPHPIETSSRKAYLARLPEAQESATISQQTQPSYNSNIDDYYQMRNRLEQTIAPEYPLVRGNYAAENCKVNIEVQHFM